MKNRIQNVMASVFEIDPANINEDASPDSIESWDSLKHMNLIVALEEEFQIEFEDEEILDMVNYKIIAAMIQAKQSGK